MQHFLNANFKCRDQQVHGITFEVPEKIVAVASRHQLDVARMITAAYTLAFYAVLRPTEYMLTPRHSTFDETRHVHHTCPSLIKMEKKLLKYLVIDFFHSSVPQC